MFEELKIDQNQEKKRQEIQFMHRLAKYLVPYKKKVGILMVLMISSSILSVLPTLILQYAIDNFIIKQNPLGLALVSIGLLVYGGVLGLQNYFQNYISQYIGHNVVRDIRNEIFDHINHLSFTFFDKTSTGDVVSRIMSDTERLRMFMANGFVDFIMNSIILLGTMVVMFYWNVQFGLIYLGVFPFIGVGTYFFTKKVMPNNRRSRTANSLLTKSIQECFNGIKEVKLYNREQYMFNIFKKWNDDYFDAVLESNRYNAIYGPYIPFLLNIVSTLFLLTGALLSLDPNTGITIGLIIALFAYFGILSGPVRSVTRFVDVYNWAKTAGERIFEILDQERFVRDLDTDIFLHEIKGEIKFNEVFFEYDPDHEILKNINLDITSGEIIALVGPSGVGKTTLAHLVPRFYEPKSGIITIDGVDIQQLNITALRRNVGIVMQNVFLFDGSIADNVSYGKENATREEVNRAIDIAQLREFVNSLPKGLDTPIGERGVKVSGGQAQRISLARVLVTDPKILIMDEPTSNVDAITDKKLMHAVQTVMKNRTTIVIAHRLWTIKNADKIVLMKDGEINGIGNHKHLLKTNEFYQEFFASQFQSEEKSQQSQQLQQPEYKQDQEGGTQ